MKNRTLPALLLLAGVSWTTAQALLPDMGREWEERLTAVAAAPERQMAATALLFVAGWSLVLSAIVLARLIPAGPGGRLVRIGCFGLGLGGVWLAAGRGAFSMMMLKAVDPEVEREGAVTLLSANEGYAFLTLVPTLPALIIGPILLGIGVHKAKLANWWPLICWVAGIALFVGTEFTVKAGEIAGIAVASVGLVLIGRALATSPREFPDRPRTSDRPDVRVP